MDQCLVTATDIVVRFFKTAHTSEQCLGRGLFCLPFAWAWPPCLEAGTVARAIGHMPYAASSTLRGSGSSTSEGVQQVRRQRHQEFQGVQKVQLVSERTHVLHG